MGCDLRSVCQTCYQNKCDLVFRWLRWSCDGSLMEVIGNRAVSRSAGRSIGRLVSLFCKLPIIVYDSKFDDQSVLCNHFRHTADKNIVAGSRIDLLRSEHMRIE